MSYGPVARAEFGLLHDRMGRYGVRVVSEALGQREAGEKTEGKLSRASLPTSGPFGTIQGL